MTASGLAVARKNAVNLRSLSIIIAMVDFYIINLLWLFILVNHIYEDH